MLKFRSLSGLPLILLYVLSPSPGHAQSLGQTEESRSEAAVNAPGWVRPDYTKPPYRAARAPAGPVQIPPPPQTEPSAPSWGGERYRVLQDPADQAQTPAPAADTPPEKIGPAYKAPSDYSYVLHQRVNSWGSIAWFSPTGKTGTIAFSQTNNILINSARSEMYEIPLKIVSIVSQPGTDYLLIQVPDGTLCGDFEYAVVSVFYNISQWDVAGNYIQYCAAATQFYADRKTLELNGETLPIDALTLIFGNGAKWNKNVRLASPTRGVIK
jgi:hypothetical protein